MHKKTKKGQIEFIKELIQLGKKKSLLQCTMR